MSFFLQLLVSGFSLGMIYALIAIGLVIILKCSDAFNVAQGHFVLMGGYLGYTFLVPLGLPIWASIILSIIIGSDMNVTAVFSRPTYNVTIDINPSDGGTISLEPPQPVEGYLEGTSLTLTAIASNGYEFRGWSGSLLSPNNPITIDINSNKQISAIFTKLSGSSSNWWWILIGIGVVGLLIYFIVLRRFLTR